jgi:replicative DNA helicase
MIIDATVLFDLLKLIVNRNDEKVKRLFDSIVELYSENLATISPSDVKYCELYITICKEVISSQLNVEHNKIDIINIFKRHLNTATFKKDGYIRDALKAVVDTEVTAKRITDITVRMNNLIAWHISKRYINKLYGSHRESNLSYSMESQTDSLDNIKTILEEFRDTLTVADAVINKNGPVECIDFTDKNTIRAALKTFKQRRVDNVLKTGWQGLNEMFGDAGGMALGESILFAARSHNYKSGMLAKMLPWIMRYNDPPKLPGKKPMILFISLEDEGYQKMMQTFKDVYIGTTGELPSKDMSDEDMVNSIYESFNQSEYTVVIERYLPSGFGFNEMISLIERYENAGYKIIATIVDYVTQMKRGNNSRNGDHAAIQELCNGLVNFFKAIGTTFITAAQLNRDASDIAASGIPNPVKRYSERHLAGSTGIFREFDFIAFLEIEKDEQGRIWLTMNWGKHRHDDNMPLNKRFCCYMFNGPLGIADDINTEFTGSRNIYAKANAKQASAADIESILGIS